MERRAFFLEERGLCGGDIAQPGDATDERLVKEVVRDEVEPNEDGNGVDEDRMIALQQM